MLLEILKKYFFKYNKSFDNCKSIFLGCPSYDKKSKIINNFIDNILPQIKNPIILIIADGDYTFPNQIDKRGPKYSDNFNNKVQKFI